MISRLQRIDGGAASSCFGSEYFLPGLALVDDGILATLINKSVFCLLCQNGASR